MSENYENKNSDLVHVDAYTKDDGTHVCEYWRRRPGNGGASSGGFLDEKYSNSIPNGGFAPPNPLDKIDASYNYPLGEILLPHLQNNGGIVEPNHIDMNESYIPYYNNNFIEGGVTWTRIINIIIILMDMIKIKVIKVI